MIRFPTNYLLLEGPDLAGKTTFYQALHDASKYTWNIHDRSCLSMIVHANQYDRPDFVHRENFKRELLNLNNRFVILLPSLDETILRYQKRGDEIQTLENIKRLHESFSTHAEALSKFPNVHVVRSTDLYHSVDKVRKSIMNVENASLDGVSQHILEFVKNTKESEATPLSFTLFDDGRFLETDASIMNHKPEKDYYDKILNDMLLKIDSELKGKNEYNRIESVNSRRFIYTDDTCISLIHASYRNTLLDVHFVLRSSEVKTTFCYDLKFLYYLTERVYNLLKLKIGRDQVRMRFDLNSAHILSKIHEE